MPPTLITALVALDEAHRETADLVSRIHASCVELKTSSAQSRQCITESRKLLRSVSDQLGDSVRDR